ncbi:expressed unknown protein [Seminavis robusta]|uniref:Uncharacterized protein n=1 Tax=Seminavis robusta TaxID=568900 RepID=A0A9N8E8A2_9STRA|nr:expressed unknown protein [Seminavis robusta]|eukprot:Sro792_g203200.1 n/a (464) ;mRNA; r:46328-47813
MAPSSSSTALAQTKAPSTKNGSLQVRPLQLVPTNPNKDEPTRIPTCSGNKVTLWSVGQTLRVSLRQSSAPSTIGAPLSHLYHAQLGVQIECDDKTVYRGSYDIDELPIHQTAVISIPLAIHQRALVVSNNSQRSQGTTTSSNTSTMAHTSSLSLQVECTLRGPPRTEIVKAHQALSAWLTVVDKVEDLVREVWSKLEPQIPNAAKKKQALLLLIPAIGGIMIPLTTACIVISPAVIGFCILFFPIMIPVVVGTVLFVLATVLGSGLLMTLLYNSTRHGRTQLCAWWNQQSTLQQYWQIAKGPRFGVQTFYYATGPRPTPVTLVRTQLPKTRWRRLGVSLTIDGVGSFSYLLPFLGEAFDVVWAPAQTVLIMALYQHVSPNMSYVSFAEEMLPFLDVLPSATSGWLMEFGPELWEEAKELLENPKESLESLQLVLWGNQNSNTQSRRPSHPSANRRPVPRPSRH